MTTPARGLRQIIYTLLLVLFLKDCTPLLTAGTPVKIQVTPRIGSAPQEIRIWLTVEPNADNRVACVVVDGPKYRSSCWELRGASAPKTTWLQFRDLPEGHYVVAGSVERVGGARSQAQTEICVVGPATGPDGCFGGEL